MAEEGLCWKCKDTFKSHCSEYGLDGFFANQFLHCHHEPKEKPKCWCNPYVFALSLEDKSRQKYIDIGDKTVPINFCPQCGRKLGD